MSETGRRGCGEDRQVRGSGAEPSLLSRIARAELVLWARLQTGGRS